MGDRSTQRFDKDHVNAYTKILESGGRGGIGTINKITRGLLPKLDGTPGDPGVRVEYTYPRDKVAQGFYFTEREFEEIVKRLTPEARKRIVDAPGGQVLPADFPTLPQRPTSPQNPNMQAALQQFTRSDASAVGGSAATFPNQQRGRSSTIDV